MRNMRWFTTFKHWYRRVFRRSVVEQELNEELEFFLDHHIKENLARGMSPEEARREALRTFGSVLRVKDACRDAWKRDP